MLVSNMVSSIADFFVRTHNMIDTFPALTPPGPQVPSQSPLDGGLLMTCLSMSVHLRCPPRVRWTAAS